MENDINKILAQKQAWRSAERRKGDRRKKDGTIEERKVTADLLRATRAFDRNVELLDPQPRSVWTMFLRFIGVLTVIILLFFTTKAVAFTHEQAVKAIIGEAENQGSQGMLYVACAIHNRGTLKGVFGLHAPRIVNHKYSNNIYNQAELAWEKSEAPEACSELAGAKNWENTDAFGVPYWAKGMKVVLVYKDHKFFK